MSDDLKSLNNHLRSWLDQNPVEIGVHWYSNLEISLRAIAWVQILELAGDRLDRDVKREMLATLRHAGRHLLVELPYTLSSMRNNHLLGDALGMITIGEMFSTTREGRILSTVGNRIFDQQLERQVHDDGSMIEDSISYHRFVLEMLAVRMLLPRPPEDVRDALERSAQFMFRLGVAEGPVPQYGDWDEGRVLAVSGDKTELLGSARLGLALAGSGAPEEWHEQHDEVAWYAPRGEPVEPQPAERTGRDIGGGIARAAVGPFTVWLKAGSQPSHGHADLTSVAIARDGHWLIGDPGTGTYNGPIEQRNYFRCSIAHDVVRVEGLDQLEPHRAFRWLHRATGVIGPPLQLPDGTVLMWGAHDAYRRLTPHARRIARAVLVASNGVTITDWVEGPPTTYALSIPLPPDVDHTTIPLYLPGEPTVIRGSVDPYDGWWSRTYGTTELATRLELRGKTDKPIVWTVGDRAVPVVSAQRVSAEVHELEMTWADQGARLRCVSRVDDDGTSVEQVAFLRLA